MTIHVVRVLTVRVVLVFTVLVAVVLALVLTAYIVLDLILTARVHAVLIFIRTLVLVRVFALVLVRQRTLPALVVLALRTVVERRLSHSGGDSVLPAPVAVGAVFVPCVLHRQAPVIVETVHQRVALGAVDRHARFVQFCLRPVHVHIWTNFRVGLLALFILLYSFLKLVFEHNSTHSFFPLANGNKTVSYVLILIIESCSGPVALGRDIGLRRFTLNDSLYVRFVDNSLGLLTLDDSLRLGSLFSNFFKPVFSHDRTHSYFPLVNRNKTISYVLILIIMSCSGPVALSRDFGLRRFTQYDSLCVLFVDSSLGLLTHDGSWRLVSLFYNFFKPIFSHDRTHSSLPLIDWNKTISYVLILIIESSGLVALRTCSLLRRLLLDDRDRLDLPLLDYRFDLFSLHGFVLLYRNEIIVLLDNVIVQQLVVLHNLPNSFLPLAGYFRLLGSSDSPDLAIFGGSVLFLIDALRHFHRTALDQDLFQPARLAAVVVARLAVVERLAHLINIYIFLTVQLLLAFDVSAALVAVDAIFVRAVAHRPPVVSVRVEPRHLLSALQAVHRYLD